MAEGDYLPRVMAVRVVRDRVVHLTFDDGLEGEVDLRPKLSSPVFDRLARDDEFFNQIDVDFETIVWPGDLDMAPEPLYDEVKAANADRSTTHR
ncbi:MAG: DUF2442 domain-containing protein [Jiangellaceae bacterium]